MGIKKILPRGLLGRSLLIIVIPLVLLQIVTGIIFYDRHWANVSRHRANSLTGDISFVVQLLQASDSPATAAELISMVHRLLNLQVEILPSGPGIDGSFRPSGNLQRTLAASLDGPFASNYLIDTDADPDQVLIWLNFGDRVLRVSTSRERLISSTTRIFVVWMVGTSIILFGVATLFMRNQIRPLRRLARAAESFGKGHIETDLHPSGSTEVRQAATAFLAMRERIRRQVQQRTVMLAGVSHDLRTPLTRMKLQITMLKDDDAKSDLHDDVTEMEAMITGYLDFVRGEGSEQTQDTEVGGLLTDVARNARINDKTIDVKGAPDISLPLRRDAFKRCLTNLVTNGVRHGADRVEISAYRTEEQLVIAVDDDGPGIAEDQREDVFRPFFRIDTARNLDAGGTGLGLSIALDIVHGHGGDLTLHDSPLGGLRALIRLPI